LPGIAGHPPTGSVAVVLVFAVVSAGADALEARGVVRVASGGPASRVPDLRRLRAGLRRGS